MFKRKPNPSQPFPAITAARKRRSIVALDMDGEMLHVVHASGQGASARVTRLESAPLNLPSDKKDQAGVAGFALRKALESLRVKPKEAIIGLPRGQVVLRPLQVPVVADVRELASIINFQISRDLPFRIEDAVVDFKVLRTVEVPAAGEGEPQKRLEVLVGAVRSDIVRFYRDVAAAAGFKLAGLGLRSVAAAHFARRCIGSNASFLLVSVRLDEVTLEIVSGGKLVFSRPAVVDRENLLKSLQIEVVRSLHSFEGGSGEQQIEKILVAGGGGSEAEIAAALEQSLKVKAEILNPSACIDIKKLDHNEAARAIAPIGLALSALDPSGLLIDFVNPKKPAPPRNSARTQNLLLAAAAVALLIAVLGARAHLIKKRTEVRQKVQAELTDAEKKLPIYRRLKTQAKSVSAWTAEEQNWLDHLAYLSSIFPPADQIYISGLTITPQHIMRFSVNSKTGELLAGLDKQLRAAGYEVRPLSITPASDKHGYNFRTTVELIIPKRMKPDASKVKPVPRPEDDSSLKQAATIQGGQGAS